MPILVSCSPPSRAVPTRPRGSTPTDRAPLRVGARAAPLAPRPGRAPRGARRGRPHGRRRGRPARVPPGAHALAVLRGHARRAGGRAAPTPEPLPGGPTHEFAAELAAETGRVRARVAVRGSRPTTAARLQHRDLRRARRRRCSPAPASSTSRSPRATTRTATSGPATAATRWSPIAGAAFGFPTCWDQWFPEVARAYSLAGAEVLVYPTAIGSEPDHPGFDTEPLWEQVIVANGIANGTFMVARQPHRQRGAAHVLRLVVHQRPVRPGAGAGTARRAGGAGRRPRPRPAARLARTCSRSSPPAAPTPTARLPTTTEAAGVGSAGVGSPPEPGPRPQRRRLRDLMRVVRRHGW